MPAEMFRVIASFVDAEGEPLTGAEYAVKLRDEDPLFDDKLGVSTLNAAGEAEFLFTTADIVSVDSPNERKPDLYFIVTRNGREIFHSQVFDDVDFDAVDPVTGRGDGLTRRFGPFRISES